MASENSGTKERILCDAHNAKLHECRRASAVATLLWRFALRGKSASRLTSPVIG